MSITQEQADEVKATLMKAVKQCADLIHTIDEYSAVGDLINSIDSLIEKQPLHYDGEPFNDEYEFTGKYRMPTCNDDAFVDIFDVANVNTYGIMENINECKRWILRKRKQEPEPSFEVGDWVTYLDECHPFMITAVDRKVGLVYGDIPGIWYTVSLCTKWEPQPGEYVWWDGTRIIAQGVTIYYPACKAKVRTHNAADKYCQYYILGPEISGWTTIEHLSPLSARPEPERPPQFSTWTPDNQKQYMETR
jgi:hypothetical protein